MAVFGLQVDFTDDLLKQYFGMKQPNIIAKQIYIGLGLTQEGAQQNLEDFNEVFSGKPLGNYTRARVIFGKAHNNQISNISEVAFQTASEDWTTPKCLVEMLGLFDTMEYMDAETKQLIKPLSDKENEEFKDIINDIISNETVQKMKEYNYFSR